MVPLGPATALVKVENGFRVTFAGKPLPSRVVVSEI
jgi:hypothetical protein